MDEQEYQQELREQSETGRKAKIAHEVVSNFIENTRSMVVQKLEDGAFDHDDFLYSVMYLRILKRFERAIQTSIDIGTLAEKELNENGSN